MLYYLGVGNSMREQMKSYLLIQVFFSGLYFSGSLRHKFSLAHEKLSSRRRLAFQFLPSASCHFHQVLCPAAVILCLVCHPGLFVSPLCLVLHPTCSPFPALLAHMR